MPKNPLTRDRTRDLKITSSMRTRQLQSCALPAELSEELIVISSPFWLYEVKSSDKSTYMDSAVPYSWRRIPMSNIILRTFGIKGLCRQYGVSENILNIWVASSRADLLTWRRKTWVRPSPTRMWYAIPRFHMPLVIHHSEIPWLSWINDDAAKWTSVLP
mgnify:CR=1 FL=1